MVNYILMAIPVFFLLIGVELLWARHEKKEIARLNDSINDLSCGILQQITGVFTKTAVFAGYVFVFERFRLLEIPNASLAGWVICFFGVDLCYYWFHRMSHEVGFAWAAHVVHHQSEEYNLSVALRQGSLQPFVSAVFYWPLALIGFPPAMFLTLSAFNTLYQFWIHTRLIGRLGPLEVFLNTPSHHRVHHGCNPEYIDRNHGGILIVWDKLFGTFEEERAEVVYGVTRPLASWNPIRANYDYFVTLARTARRLPRWRDKLLLWIKPPGWLPDDVADESPPASPLDGVRYDAHADPGLHLYVLAQFGGVLAATLWLLAAFADLPAAARGGLTLFVVWSLVGFGGIFERRRWALPAETGRLVLAAAGALWLLDAGLLPPAAVGAVGAACVASVVWLARLRGTPRDETPADPAEA